MNCNLKIWYLDLLEDGVFDGELTSEQTNIITDIKAKMKKKGSVMVSCDTLNKYQDILQRRPQKKTKHVIQNPICKQLSLYISNGRPWEMCLPFNMCNETNFCQPSEYLDFYYISVNYSKEIWTNYNYLETIRTLGQYDKPLHTMENISDKDITPQNDSCRCCSWLCLYDAILKRISYFWLSDITNTSDDNSLKTGFRICSMSHSQASSVKKCFYYNILNKKYTPSIGNIQEKVDARHFSEELEISNQKEGEIMLKNKEKAKKDIKIKVLTNVNCNHECKTVRLFLYNPLDRPWNMCVQFMTIRHGDSSNCHLQTTGEVAVFYCFLTYVFKEVGNYTYIDTFPPSGEIDKTNSNAKGRVLKDLTVYISCKFQCSLFCIYEALWTRISFSWLSFTSSSAKIYSGSPRKVKPMCSSYKCYYYTILNLRYKTTNPVSHVSQKKDVKGICLKIILDTQTQKNVSYYVSVCHFASVVNNMCLTEELERYNLMNVIFDRDNSKGVHIETGDQKKYKEISKNANERIKINSNRYEQPQSNSDEKPISEISGNKNFHLLQEEDRMVKKKEIHKEQQNIFQKEMWEHISKINNLEMQLLKLENTILLKDVNKSNDIIQFTQFENDLLRMEKALLQINQSFTLLRTENEQLKRSQVSKTEELALAMKKKSSCLPWDKMVQNIIKQQTREITELAHKQSKINEMIQRQLDNITQAHNELSNTARSQNDRFKELHVKFYNLEKQQALQGKILESVLKYISDIKGSDNLPVTPEVDDHRPDKHDKHTEINNQNIVPKMNGNELISDEIKSLSSSEEKDPQENDYIIIYEPVKSQTDKEPTVIENQSDNDDIIINKQVKSQTNKEPTVIENQSDNDYIIINKQVKSQTDKEPTVIENQSDNDDIIINKQVKPQTDKEPTVIENRSDDDDIIINKPLKSQSDKEPNVIDNQSDNADIIINKQVKPQTDKEPTVIENRSDDDDIIINKQVNSQTDREPTVIENQSDNDDIIINKQVKSQTDREPTVIENQSDNDDIIINKQVKSQTDREPAVTENQGDNDDIIINKPVKSQTDKEPTVIENNDDNDDVIINKPVKSQTDKEPTVIENQSDNDRDIIINKPVKSQTDKEPTVIENQSDNDDIIINKPVKSQTDKEPTVIENQSDNDDIIINKPVKSQSDKEPTVIENNDDNDDIIINKPVKSQSDKEPTVIENNDDNDDIIINKPVKSQTDKEPTVIENQSDNDDIIINKPVKSQSDKEPTVIENNDDNDDIIINKPVKSQTDKEPTVIDNQSDNDDIIINQPVKSQTAKRIEANSSNIKKESKIHNAIDNDHLQQESTLSENDKDIDSDLRNNETKQQKTSKKKTKKTNQNNSEQVNPPTVKYQNKAQTEPKGR